MTTRPTTTTYALLGLLDLRPWAAYDLTQQMRRALRWAWPRSEANLYNEAKRLVRLGYATAETERHGQRTRTVYEITDHGREALRSWLADEPVTPPQLEAELLLRLFIADRGDKDALARVLSETRGHTEDAARELMPILEEYRDGEGPFPERMHLNMAFARFIAGFYELIVEWCDEMEREMEEWPDTRDVGETEGARRMLEEALAFYEGHLSERTDAEVAT